MRGGPVSAYRDQHFKGSRSEQERLLRLATTMYVGNMSFFTTEEQIYELFSKAGEVKRIVMGLDRFRKTPCGFCFVEYYTRMDAENCMKYVNGTRLDDRVVRTDWDAGFQEGRQYGRGKTGGQVRDEYRTDYDPGRGGFGKIVAQRVSVVAGADETAVKVEEDAAPAAKRRKTGHEEVQETGDVEDAADVGGEVADEVMNDGGVEVDVKDIPKDPPNPLNRS